MGMVPVIDSSASHHILDPAQRHRMDKKQALSTATGKSFVHYYGRSCPAVLDFGDLCQLCILQFWQQAFFQLYAST